MDMSDYIPLIIIVGAIAMSIVKGLKKNAGEEMERTLLPGRRPGEEITSFPTPASKKEKPTQAKAIQKNKREVLTKNETSFHQTKVAKEPDPVFDEAYDTPGWDISDPDEIKQAVIYSEILNRREY
jgi:hypothetical protein